MVDGQIRPNRVRDPRILNAMRTLPRERFLPPHLAHLAYVDEDVPLGRGRVLMEPLVIARLVKLCAPQPGERGLVVGSGTGYGAALLAACGVDVVALEDDPELRAIAAEAWQHVPTEEGGRITAADGPLPAGWAQGGPYDMILIEGAVREIPPAIVSQLKPSPPDMNRVNKGGPRLVTVVSYPGTGRQAVLAEPSVGGLRCQSEFDCGTPFLPALLPKPGFVF
jgi:protein-L-isoaspartate(D-aspartate) O-methyltransferase